MASGKVDEFNFGKDIGRAQERARAINAISRLRKQKMTNDNKRLRAPPLIITKGMLDAGVKLFEFMAADPENHTDQALVGGVFTEMWRVYWEEVQAVGKRKSAGSPIVQIEPQSRLILPHRLKPKDGDSK